MQDVRTQNVTAATAIANIVKSSLGPVGLDKMLVDEVKGVLRTIDIEAFRKLYHTRSFFTTADAQLTAVNVAVLLTHSSVVLFCRRKTMIYLESAPT